MALTQKALQKKREKHNQSRKGKRYNPKKYYYRVENGRLVEQDGPTFNPVKETLTL